MEHSSSDSLDALSVSAFSKGLTTNDLTNDSQGTYCELGEQSQQLGSQDIFDSQASSISALEYSNGNNSCRQSGKDFSTITTSSTPLTKRKRDTVKEEDGHSSSSDFENLRRTKIKSSDKVQEAKEKRNEDRLSGESGGSQGKNNTIFISSASGENSQLNFSQLDTQLKLLTDIDDLGGGEAGEPVVMSSNGLNHTELHNMSTNSYNSHQIRATAQNENWGNKKVITKTYSANVTIKEVRSETTNQVLSLHISELALCNESPNFSPLVNKIGFSSGGRDSLSSGSVYSVGPFPLKGQTHEQRMSCVSSSSSSTLASSAATLAFRNQHKLVQKDGPPVQCINCNYKFKQPVPPPPTVSTPDLVSSGPENISSSVCEDETAPAPSSTPPEFIEVNTANQTISPSDDTKKFKSPPRHPTATDPPLVPPIPILQATRRSSFTKKFTTLEQIKEEAKPTPVKSSTLTPKKKGRPRKKPAPEVVPPEEIEEPVSEKIKVKEMDESVPEKKKAKNKRKLELTDGKKKKMDQNEEDQQSKGERKAEGQKGGGGNKGRRSVDGGEGGVESSKAGKKEKKELISGPDHLQGGRLEENTPPNVMAANVYDPGKTVLAIWTDKIYYPAVIEEDLQSFLRVRYLDGFVKKIIKQQTVPMSVLYEDTPVHVMTEEDDELKPGKLKAFDESQRVCTVEWTEESSLATVNFECLRMFPEHVRVIQNKYTSVLESPKLHQLTLDNILQRKRTPARRHDGHSDGSLSQCSSSSRGNHSSSGLSSSSISSSASKRPRKADKSLSLPENRSESAGGVASARKKKVLEEKVDNTGNRGAKCRQRIFDADTSKGQKKIKSKPPSTKGSKPGAGGTLGPRKSSGKSFLSDSPQPSCSKSTPGERENKFRPTSHVDIDVTEYCPSSDSEHELHSINMEGFDMDFVQPESDCETFAEIVSNRAVDRLCGPIPASGLDLFSGYVFVVSHSNQGLDYGSDGNLSDQQYEALTSKFPFRRRRLEHQLTKGGGTVFPSLNLVPHEKLENTLLITDRPGTTCNFILALAMRVPVLHYYYVIQCCVTKTHIKKHRLPEMSSGYSLEEKCLLDRNLTSANILGEYLIVIAMSAKTQTVIFWEKVLKFAGASVKRWKPNFDWDTLTTVCSSMQVAILIDDPEDTPDEVLAQSYDRILPTWIIQSLIHAQARDFNAHPAYRKKYPAGTHPGMNVSETY